MKPNVLIIRTAGTNCDKESEYAFKTAGAQTYLHHINYIKNKKDFSDYQILCIPGGFSYGDDLGAGKILSLEFLCWLRDHLADFIKKGGLIIGICNGFQVLVKTGILPDLDFVQKVTLANNDSGGFEDRWVNLKTTDVRRQKLDKKIDCVWLRDMPEVISIPVAHGEGKFYADQAVLDRIDSNGQAVLRYCDSGGNKCDYPFNPNGSLARIAGITDQTGKVLGLMPHPERCIKIHHSPFWKDKEVRVDGLKFFENAVDYFK